MPFKMLIPLLLLINPAVSIGQRLKQYDPPFRDYTEDKLELHHENGIPLPTIKRLGKYLLDRYGSESGVSAALYQTSPKSNFYFASVSNTSDLYFILLKEQENTVTEVSKFKNTVICTIDDETLFVGKDRRLIIVSMMAGDGGFCGNFPYELKDGKLTSLGELAVFDGVDGPGAYVGSSPINKSTFVEYKGGTYYVTLRGRGPLYSEDKWKKLAPAHKPLTFFFDGKTFRVLKRKEKRKP